MIKQWIEKQKIKSKMHKCFRHCKMYHEKKQGDKKIRIYPQIVNIKTLDDRLEVVFILQTGLSTEAIDETIFKQVFGKNIEIKHDKIKKCVLNVYKNEIPKTVNYDFHLIKNHVAKMQLPFICGLDIHGEILMVDLATESHLLLSAETGGGKSSLLRANITFLIENGGNYELILFDLKRSEFGMFRNCRNVKGVYITTSDILPTLKKIEKEMKFRGDLLDQNEVNSIDELDIKLKRILVVIDEVALLRKEKEIMGIVEDISSIGRSLGVHLVLSMQRPDSKILESGNLKNNLRVRISGRQSNSMNAKVAGVEGAENIGMNQRGRMVIKLDDIQEFQGFYLDSAEAKKILKQYKVKGHVQVETEQQQEVKCENILGVLDE